MTSSPLARRLGTGDAVVIGLSSMIGAGVFAVFGPAARAAGSGLLIGLGVAAAVAYCNAVSSAQLAAAYPTSGGTYVYGRERLGPWWGFAAGWLFVVGKSASCAAMAMTVASYTVSDHRWLQRAIGVAAVGLLTAVNCRGITRTAALARVIVLITLAVLAVVVIAIWTGDTDTARLDIGSPSVHGVLQAAGLLFFAFAGYARVATLGEEVRDPARTLPRAIPVALGATLLVYAIVAVSALAAAGPNGLATSTAPLRTALVAAGSGGVTGIVRIGAAIAALGALLSLIAGVGRTTLAMARNGDLPTPLATVSERYQVPYRAEITVAIIVSVVVLSVDLRGAIAFSSFGVLLYYAIANIAAFTQPAAQRRWPRALNILGLLGCAVLAASLPWRAIALGTGVLAVGLLGRAVAQRQRVSSEPGKPS